MVNSSRLVNVKRARSVACCQVILLVSSSTVNFDFRIPVNARYIHAINFSYSISKIVLLTLLVDTKLVLICNNK